MLRPADYRHKEIFREKTLLSDKTFDRIKNGELIKPELETVMALCFGLNLGANHSFQLLNSAGFDFTNTQVPLYIVYKKLLYAHNITNIFQCNEILENLGYGLLCEKEYRSVLAKKQN